ncbi:hypothetical protein AAMO2058_001047700 [Amorphochlora amoebiformis]
MGNRSYTTGGGSSTEVYEYIRALNQKFGYQFLEKLNGGRVVKTCLCQFKGNGKVILGVYPKQEATGGSEPTEEVRVRPVLLELETINKKLTLASHPGVVSNKLIHETKQAFYFSRQFFAFNMFDRFHHRPFFSTTDKHWIAYQLLQAMMQLHESNIHHGGLKCENIVLTTWNWIFVTDIAFYKPGYLPADNPSTYNYFFDAEKQRKPPPCYLSPERFYDSKEGSPIESQLTSAMDIFAAGCCIAEIFLDGNVIFDYSQMLRYRNGTYSPDEALSKIRNPDVRKLIQHMIQLDPKKRLGAGHYLGEEIIEDMDLAKSVNAVFPHYFRDLYHKLKRLLDPSFASPDDKILYLYDNLHSIITLIIGRPYISSRSDQAAPSPDSQEQASSEPGKNGRADIASTIAEIERFLKEDKSVEFKEDVKTRVPQSSLQRGGMRLRGRSQSPSKHARRTAEIRGTQVLRVSTLRRCKNSKSELNGLAILVGIVGSCIQSLNGAMTRVCALGILEAVTQHCPSASDKLILELVIPYVMFLSDDPHSIVRYKVVQLLALALDRVGSLSFVEQNVLHEFIMPTVVKLHPDYEKDQRVQIAICKLIPRLMRSARRFLDLAHRLRHKSAVKSPKETKVSGYDAELMTLKGKILKLVVGFLAQGSSKAKIALLHNFLPICEFLGKELVEEHMMVHLTTILNETDWELRASMFRHIPSFSQFLGRGSPVMKFLLPIMEEALYDSELFVSYQALQALTRYTSSMIKASSAVGDGVMDRTSPKTKNYSRLVAKVSPLLLHPSVFVRREACKFMVILAEVLGPARSYTTMFSVLSNFTTQPVMLITEVSLLESLCPALSERGYQKGLDICQEGKTGLERGIEALRTDKDFETFSEKILKDLYIYFTEVNRKQSLDLRSGTPKSARTPPNIASRSPAKKPPPEDPGRRAVVYSMSLEPTQSKLLGSMTERRKRAGNERGGDAKARRERKRALDVSPSAKFGGMVPPSNSIDVVKTAFDIPLSADENVNLDIQKPLAWYSSRVRPRPPEDDKQKAEQIRATWIPKGILVAEARHDGAVSGIAVCDDNRWLLSGSADGSMRIWDVGRFAQIKDRLGVRAEAVYDSVGSRVTGVTICGGTRRAAGVADDGSVHAFVVDYGQNFSLRGAKKLDTKSKGNATTVSHADTLSKSLLLYGTKSGRVHCWDFRRNKEAFVLDLAMFTDDIGTKCFGSVTASTVGPSGYTLFVGTSHGFVILWDIRYQQATSIWRHSSNSPIVCLAVASGDAMPARVQTNTKAPMVLVSVKGVDEISAFCVLTGVCRAIFKVVGSTSMLAKSGGWTKVKRRSPGGKNKDNGWSHANRSSIVNPLSLPALRVYNLRHAGMTDRFFQEFSKPLPVTKETRGFNSFLLHERKGLITGGRDRVVRFWHLTHIEKSRRITEEYLGPYQTKFSQREENATLIYEEQLLRELDASSRYSGITYAGERVMPKGPFTTPNVHKEQITDLQAIDHRERLLASADSQGVIKIWR